MLCNLLNWWFFDDNVHVIVFYMKISLYKVIAVNRLQGSVPMSVQQVPVATLTTLTTKMLRPLRTTLQPRLWLEGASLRGGPSERQTGRVRPRNRSRPPSLSSARVEVAKWVIRRHRICWAAMCIWGDHGQAAGRLKIETTTRCFYILT